MAAENCFKWVKKSHGQIRMNFIFPEVHATIWLQITRTEVRKLSLLTVGHSVIDQKTTECSPPGHLTLVNPEDKKHK